MAVTPPDLFGQPLSTKGNTAAVESFIADTASPPEPPLTRMARNVVTRYVLLAITVVVGILMVRFNVTHLGPDGYGLWMLAASITTYFTVLEFGYGTGLVKFIAEHRAARDNQGLNEVLSTMWYLFAGIGVLCYAIAIATAALLPWLFTLAPGQESTGRLILLIVAVQVALYFPFSVYGSVVNAFERYDLNNLVAIVFQLATCAVNVAVLHFGYGLPTLVAAMTVMRVLPLWVYRRNARSVFPAIDIRWAHVRRDGLRHLTAFSVYVAVTAWASRIAYTTALLYLGVFLNTTAVFIYAVAQRLTDNLLMLTEQLHTFMMPAIVSRAADDTIDRQRTLMVRTTRLQLGSAVCLCTAVAAIAHELIRAWLGPAAEGSAAVTQALAAVVVLRAWTGMPATVLQGTGHHRYVAAVASASALTSIVLCVPLVQIWGPVGVAIGTMGAAAVSAILVFVRACRVIGLSTAEGARRIVLPAVWPVAIVLAVLPATQRVLPPGLVPTLGNLCFGAALYAAIFLLVGLDREERRWLLSACRTIAQGPRRLAVDAAA